MKDGAYAITKADLEKNKYREHFLPFPILIGYFIRKVYTLFLLVMHKKMVRFQ
jgi:hypothetical protein